MVKALAMHRTGHGHVVVPTGLHITNNVMVIGESLEVGDKEGRELFVLPCEPELVTSIPRQGVEVYEEGGLLLQEHL